MIQNRNTPSCKVCENPCAKKCYNSFVCNPCRVFFARRSPFENVGIRCSASGNCEINYRKKRMNCAPCRLKKCYELQLTKTEHEKDVVDSVALIHKSYPPIKNLMIMYGEIMNNGFKIIENLKNCESTCEWVELMAHSEDQLLSRKGASASSVTANIGISLLDLIMFPGSCIDRSTKAVDIFSESSKLSINPKITYKLRENLLRFYVAAIETLSLIDEFHLLPNVDKIRLVQQNALMMPCYFISYYFRDGWDTEKCAKYLERYNLGDGPSAVPWKNIVATLKSGGFGRIHAMEDIHPTEKEIMLLRIISYFRPGVEHTDEGYHIIIRTRLKLAAILGEHIRETHPTFTAGEVQNRLRQILEMEDLIKVFATRFHNAYMLLTSLGAFGFDTPLLRDIFIRNY